MTTKELLIIEDDLKDKDDSEVLELSIATPEIFSVIVERYEKLFLDKATKILRSKEEAHDVVQDTFVKIYIHADKFTPQEGATFKSWAYKILLNTCFSFCKKKKREREFMSKLDDETMALFGAPDGAFEKQVILDRFLTVVSKIPVALARVLRMAVVQGKSNEDIANEEGITVGAVRTRLHRARKEFETARNKFELKTNNNYEQ